MEFQGFRQVDPRQLSTSLSPEKMGSKFGEQNTNYCLECARSLDVLFEIKCTVVQQMVSKFILMLKHFIYMSL